MPLLYINEEDLAKPKEILKFTSIRKTEHGIKDYHKVAVGTHEGKRIVIGCDENGRSYKKGVIIHLSAAGYEITDVGAPGRREYDCIRIASDIGRLVDHDTVGIGISYSGVDMMIPASKSLGVYAASCRTPESASGSRIRDNTNMLCLGTRYSALDECIAIIETWLNTPFFYNPQRDLQHLRRFMRIQAEEAKASVRNNKDRIMGKIIEKS